MHEVIGPDMDFEQGLQTDAGSIIEPKPATFGLFARDFEAFLLPNPFKPFVIDVPAFTNQKLLNPAVSITPVATGKFNRP